MKGTFKTGIYPISLINVNTKFASKCLALRLKKVIHTLVDSHQTRYVRGRNIGGSVRLAEGLIEHAEKEDLTGIMFSSDFEKAFDSIDHCFMFVCLKMFGLAIQFVQWVKTLFKRAQSCVMNNGSLPVILHLKGVPDMAIPCPPTLHIGNRSTAYSCQGQ